MEELIQLIRKALPAGHSIPDAIIAKVAAFQILAQINLGEMLAKKALSSLRAMGVPSEQLTMPTVMGYAARMQLEEMNSIGLLARHKFYAPRTAKVKALLKDTPRHPHATEMRNAALLSDVVTFMQKHFLPTSKLLAMVAAGVDIGALPAEDLIFPRPYSDAALAAVAALSDANFVNYKIRPDILEPVDVEDLLKEALLTESEAARLGRMKETPLAKRRRAGEIPAGLYVQNAKNGNVYYITKKWVSHLTREEATSRKKS